MVEQFATIIRIVFPLVSNNMFIMSSQGLTRSTFNAPISTNCLFQALFLYQFQSHFLIFKNLLEQHSTLSCTKICISFHGLPELEEARQDLLPQTSERAWPCQHLYSRLLPLKLWEDTFLLFITSSLSRFVMAALRSQKGCYLDTVKDSEYVYLPVSTGFPGIFLSLF